MGPVFHSFEPPPLYRPRNARASPLYQLFETYYEDVKAVWEDRFQKKLIRNMSTTLRHSQAAFSEPLLWRGDS